MKNFGYAAREVPMNGIRSMFVKASKYNDVVNLCLGEPGFTTPDSIIQKAVNVLTEDKETQYTANAGIDELRQTVSRHMMKSYGTKYDWDGQVIITTGAVQALMLSCLTMLDPGDEVIIPDPSWPDYMGHIALAHATPVFAPLLEENDFKMTAAIVEPLITEKTKLIIFNSPSNPTGGVLEEKEIDEIAAMIERHKIMVVTDEPYDRIIFDDFKHVSLADNKYAKIHDYIIYINSFSKSYAMTGWRVGYACSTKSVIAAMTKILEPCTSCINAPFQRAAAFALEHADAEVEEMRVVYEETSKYTVAELNKIKGFHCIQPKGTFYIFANIQEQGKTSQEVCDEIFDECHILTSPGSAFGPSGEGFVRFSIANGMDDVTEAITRLKKHYGTR